MKSLLTRLAPLAFCLLGACASDITVRAQESTAMDHGLANVHYLEIVTPDVEATCDSLARLHGLEFGAPQADLGNARTARRADGSQIGVRAPMHDAETPVVRPYVLVDDIAGAVAAAEAAGAMIAMPPTPIPGGGSFAIYFQGDIQYGLWQR